MLKNLMTVGGMMALVVGCSANANDLGGKTSSQLSTGDNQFLTIASESNMTEIQTSQMAQSMAQSDSVKKFAQMMITDHTLATTKANEVANATGYTAPTMLDSMHQGLVDGLKGKTGSDFDKAYIAAQVTAHEDTVKATEDEANNGTNQQVKSLAIDLLPTLKAHLAAAKSLQSGGMGSMPGM